LTSSLAKIALTAGIRDFDSISDGSSITQSQCPFLSI
jgi:hypothetical protein